MTQSTDQTLEHLNALVTLCEKQDKSLTLRLWGCWIVTVRDKFHGPLVTEVGEPVKFTSDSLDRAILGVLEQLDGVWVERPFYATEKPVEASEPVSYTYVDDAGPVAPNEDV